MFETLPAIFADCVARIREGARDRRSALHTPVVGTADGAMRIMVLRAADDRLAQLRFHTDGRSPKVAAFTADAGINLLFYDPAARIQIRARGQGRVERSGPAADAAWQASSNFARRCYLAQAAPGTMVGQPVSGLPSEVEGIAPGEEQLAPARANFAVLLVKLEELDWLHLAHDGHRRAWFHRADGWTGSWLVP